tara:strand:- start:865 stop:1728 length:864 start_codon:yes stop_codon:yes gene_type:complete
MLPIQEISTKAPPIKIQGIKTKIVPIIASKTNWKDDGYFIEPFAGSCVVSLNLKPKKAILSDSNSHIIDLYKNIQTKKIDSNSVRLFLESEGKKLSSSGGEYYYEVRERFNKDFDSLDFLFLNRSCFNGMIRFNSKGKFNVPFCKKPERFSKSLITKIVNQVDWAGNIIRKNNWTFLNEDYKNVISSANKNDLIYCDPPYVGRHTDYYNNFSDEESDTLAKVLLDTNSYFILSNWHKNRYRTNEFIYKHFKDLHWESINHFYYVGSTESLRNSMEEVLIYSSKDIIN